MKAVLLMGHGGPEMLRCGEAPDPVAGPGEVLVDVHAASVNAADYKVRLGESGPKSLKFPHILGRDFSGVVAARGAAVTDLEIGDAIFGVTDQGIEGCYAEKLAIKAAIVAFLTRKWARELDYRLIKELWAFTGDRIAVRFVYEWRDDSGHWYRSHGNEQWEFDAAGLMRRREASINDVPITEAERKFRWPLGPRPADHPGLTELGL